MVLIRESGKWKVFYSPDLSSIIHYIVKDHSPVEKWRASIGKISDISINHDRLTFKIDIGEIEFKKYKKRIEKGIIVEILDGQDRPVCEAIVSKPGKDITFGWEYV